jgi:glycosyltransferase involved in cell wall biosynthesis
MTENPSNPPPRILFILPAFNEVDSVARVVNHLHETFPQAGIVVVDDGSTDTTVQRIAEVTDPRVVLYRQSVNQGKGAALRRGFAEATAEYVVVQDADLEYDPSEYGSLIEPLEAGRADVVYGSRFVSHRAHRVLYFWHSVGNKFLTLMSNVFTNLNLTDMETCYKMFRREVIQSITVQEDRFGFEPEITAKVAAAGWRVYEVGISYSGRTYGEGKKIGWRDGVRALVCIIKYSPVGLRANRLSSRQVQ